MTKRTQVPEASGIDLYDIPSSAELEQEKEVTDKIKARIQEAQQAQPVRCQLQALPERRLNRPMSPFQTFQ